MKLKNVCLMVAVLAIAVPALADHHESEEHSGMMPGVPKQMKDMAWMAGHWDVAVKSRMTPDAEWVKSTGSAEVMIMADGAVMVSTFSGMVMGMPIEGVEVTNYHRGNGMYESKWVDNMTGQAMHTTGTMKDGKLVMTGEDVMMGTPYTARSTMTKKGDDSMHWMMEMSFDKGASWFTTMDMTYTRSSEGAR